MKRLYLSFTIVISLALCVACGGDEAYNANGNPGDGNERPDDPRKERDGGSDAGARDSGAQDSAAGQDASAPGSDAGTADASSADTGNAADAARDTGASTGLEGRWGVELTAAEGTTCHAGAFEIRIVDTWTVGAVLMGDRIGPNPLTREGDVWNLWGADDSLVASADLALEDAKLGGSFIFYRATCEVVYDVVGTRL